MLIITAGKNEEADSLYVPAIKFKGKAVGLKNTNYTFKNTIVGKYVKFKAISRKSIILTITIEVQI